MYQSNNRRHNHPPVPTTATVQPGASVNIVLKADQPTGRTVQGVVRDILTRGNHPRGIKVRLADGRVGRVQSIASSSSSSSSSTAASNGPPPPPPTLDGSGGDVDGLVEGKQSTGLENEDYENGYEHQNRSEGAFRSGRSGRRGGRRGGRGGRGDGRFRGRPGEDEEELPSQQVGLDAYVKAAKPRRKGRGNQSTHALEDDAEQNGPESAASPQETVTCPVCGAFEGDEAAVSHHVASHFEESVS